MKMAKNKIIISILSVALIGTSTVAGIKINYIKNDSKGAKANMSVTEQEEKETAETIAYEAGTLKNTTQAKNTTTKKSANTTTATKPATISRTVAINKTMQDKNGQILTFLNAKIEDNMITIYTNLHIDTENFIHTSGIPYTLDLRDVNFVANTGEKLYVPSNRFSDTILNCQASNDNKHKWDSNKFIFLNYSPSITSITATYTFDDGTTQQVQIDL